MTRKIFFFFQAEDGIRDYKVTGVQTCALPIYLPTAMNAPRDLPASISTALHAMPDAIITFDKVNKWYPNEYHVLRDIDLQVAAGECVVICGPSGSGKSTLIRCINRLEEHQAGTLTVDGVA